MAHDEGLAERIRGVLEERGDVSEKRMFGGLAFLVRGQLTVGIVKDQLMVRRPASTRRTASAPSPVSRCVGRPPIAYLNETDDFEHQGVQRCVARPDPEAVQRLSAGQQNAHWKARICRAQHNNAKLARACLADKSFVPRIVERGPGH
jgi:hypothetical protein